MNILSYIFLRIRSSLSQTLMTLLSYLAILAVIASVQTSVQSRQNNLDAMRNAVAIEGRLADPSGSTSDHLQFDKYFARLFLEERYFLSQYTKDVGVLASFPSWIGGDIMSAELHGITSEKSHQPLYLNGGILYEEGFDQSIWYSDRPVCAIPSAFLEYVYTDGDGLRYIDVTGSFYRQWYGDTVTIPFKLQVIGVSMIHRTVYMPFYTLLNACADIPHITFTCSSLCFTVKDNNDLERFRDRAAGYFNEASLQNGGKETLTLQLKDSQYLKLTRESAKNLAVMQLMQPILYLCALGAGVMLVVMQMRSRKKEMAVIRSLGAGRLRVMAQSILEYAIICLPVTLLTLLIWRELSPLTVFGVWLAFMAGALCTIVRFSTIPLVKQIRELEE